MAIRGISANLGETPANTFARDQHPDLKADFIMANPPFNQKDWRASDELTDDPRWRGYDVPPVSNANYAWILNKNKQERTIKLPDTVRNYRNRQSEILFMDLREIGVPFEKKFTAFSEEQIRSIVKTYHDWQQTDCGYENKPEYSYCASLEEVKAKDYSLVPSKYIEFVNRDEYLDYDEKMTALQSEFTELLREEEQSKQELLRVFRELGYAINV